MTHFWPTRKSNGKEHVIVLNEGANNNPLGAIGVSLNKQKLMYNILAPSIIAIYKFLCTYGGSVHKMAPKGF